MIGRLQVPKIYIRW